jgi:hypothetical protein
MLEINLKRDSGIVDDRDPHGGERVADGPPADERSDSGRGSDRERDRGSGD